MTESNFDAVAYASTRMLHAWKVPAWIEEQAYVDGSYTCSCPAVDLAERGYDTVIAIGNEPGPIYRDLFADRIVPATYNNASIITVVPDVDPKEMDVEFTRASEQGVAMLYQHGIEKGQEVLEQLNNQD